MQGLKSISVNPSEDTEKPMRVNDHTEGLRT